MSTDKKIGPHSMVTLHFDLRLKDGSIAESTRNFNKPFKFKMGEGGFLAKLEEKLLGLSVGEKPKIMLMPADAFGEPHPASVYQVPRDKFKGMEEGELLEKGMIVLFTQPNGQEMPGLIRTIDKNEVTVDFNHPLAGQVILFDIEVLEIQD